MGEETKYTILIVEDEPTIRTALRHKLMRQGFSVFEAKNGEEGLETALKEKPDLILLDIVMPRMNGLEMVKKLREDDWGKSVKVTVLSNLGEDENTAIEVQRMSCEYFVKTNWRVEDIVANVRARLNLDQEYTEHESEE